jgi:hypothetical protein
MTFETYDAVMMLIVTVAVAVDIGILGMLFVLTR